jgi:hypothetical protein
VRFNIAALSPADTLATLQSDLQIAIQLEQATLPPYLCALWSINPSATSTGAQKAQNSILTVINEEMIHLAIACNVLNATGGQPSINGSNTTYPVPTYPGPLPAHSKTSNPFVVSLAPVGLAALQTFLAIELPDYDDPVTPPDGWATIGEFYDEIIALIQALPDSYFQSTVNGQATDNSNPTPPGSGSILTVNSSASAVAAITEIIVQGEGTKTDPDSGPNELAHYFQFQQVLDSIQNGSWNYQADVFNMVTNPNLSLANFPANAITLNNQVNSIFSTLLDGLHAAFNSTSPDDNLNAAVTAMLALQTPVQQLMQIPLNNQSGFNCGPVFQYTSAGMAKPGAAAAKR